MDAANSGHQPVADGYVWEEARRNLTLHRADQLESLHSLTRWIELHSSFAGGRVQLGEVDLPEKDLPVLASAVALQCDSLVTGDRSHFGQLIGHSVHGTTVHSPRSLAEALWP